MVSAATVKPLTVEAYLALEKSSESRHEYLDGHVLELPGSDERHSEIKDRIVDRLRAHLRDSALRLYVSAMKVRVEHGFYYPDVVVTGEPFKPHSVYLTAPRLLVEVADERSESRDRLEKLVAYRNLASLEEYAVLFDREVRMEVYRRRGPDWEQETSVAGDRYRFVSLGLDGEIDDLYREAEPASA